MILKKRLYPPNNFKIAPNSCKKNKEVSSIKINNIKKKKDFANFVKKLQTNSGGLLPLAKHKQSREMAGPGKCFLVTGPPVRISILLLLLL